MRRPEVVRRNRLLLVSVLLATALKRYEAQSHRAYWDTLEPASQQPALT
jgi:hypothetical protein